MAFTTEDNRKYRRTIARRKLILSAVAAKFGEESIPINGELLQYVIDAPTLTTDATYDFTISNEDDETLYTNGAMAETISTTVLLAGAPIPLSGTSKFKCAFASDDTVSFDVYLYYK